MAYQNKGYFIPTTQTWDVTEIYETEVTSPKFKELLVRLYQNLNVMAQAVNSKSSGIYNTQESATGRTFFPNPAYSSAGATYASSRPEFGLVLNFGALPNNTTKSLAHGLTIASNFSATKLYGAATNSTGTSFISIPYASSTAADIIELYADNTNVYVKTGKDRTSYDRCYIIFEYLKN